MLRRTKAIVLKTFPYSEADLIVTFLTPDYGILKAFAKSPRKTRSRFGSSLEPLTNSTISFWGKEDANLPRLTQSDIIRPFQPIRERLDSFIKITGLIEITISLMPERDPNRDAFRLFLDTLGIIEDRILPGNADSEEAKEFLDLVTIFYKIRLLNITGFGPSLEGCARCSRTGYNFYVSHGSIICGDCAGDGETHLRISPGAVRLYGTLRKWDIMKINRIKPSKPLISELSEILSDHAQFTIATPLKTRAFTKF